MFLFSRLTANAPQVVVTLLVFSLSAGVLGSILFYMDSAGPTVLEDFTSETYYDMEVSVTSSFYNQNQTTHQDIIEAISQQDLVNEYEWIATLSTWAHYYDEDEGHYYSGQHTYLGVEDGFFNKFPLAVETESGLPALTDDTCYMENDFLQEQGYSIGDDFTVIVETWDEETYEYNEVNHTYEIVGTFESNIFMEQIWYYYGPTEEQTTLKMITTRDGILDGLGEVGFGYWERISERVWVNLDETQILQTDTTQILDDLDDVKRRIEQDALPYGMVSQFSLRESVLQYTSWAIGLTGIAVAFSIPTIFMGILLVYYNSTLLSDERRRDVGTLKTRGASGVQAFKWIISSALLTGGIGSLGAVFVGILATYLSSSVKTFLTFSLEQLAEFTLLLQPIAVISVFAFSFGVGLLVAIPVAVKVYLMSATEAHAELERNILVEKETMGNPLVDLAVLGISAYIALPILQAMAYMGAYGMMAAPFLIMLIPIFAALIISATRLTSRPASQIKSALMARFKRIPLSVGTRVIARNVGLYKKSEALGVMFIAMVFTASVFASISADTGYQHMTELYKFQTGADITIDVKSSMSNVTTDLIENITAVDGVLAVAPVLKFGGNVRYITDDWGYLNRVNTTMTIYAVDPMSWLEAGFWLPYFTYEMYPSEALQLLVDDHTNVLASFKPIDHYTGSGWARTPVYGDDIDVYLHDPDGINHTDCTIVDVLADSEEQYSAKYLPGEPNQERFVVMNLDWIHEVLNTTHVNRFLVSIDDTNNYLDIMRAINDIAPFSFESMESPYTNINESTQSRAGQSIYGVYTLNVIFSIIYLTLGMVTVTTVRTRSLKKQYSVMRALGAESGSITSAALIDTLISLLIAAGIGGALGLGLSAFAVNIPLVYMGGTSSRLWLRLPVMIYVPYMTLMAIIGVTIMFSLIATFMVTRRVLGRNIAEEIQYME